jgi:large subunit ribosomal protein L21
MTTYAIISLGGKQYRVSEGQRLLVDRLPTEDGGTFTPQVLLVGGDGGPRLAPGDVTVTARVLGQQRGPKIRIGKYRKRTGYRRHTGFRAALTSIEIESIGGKGVPAAPKAKAAPKPKAAPAPADAPTAEPAATDLPAGYADLTVAEIKEQSGSWERPALEAALAYEHEHGQRKGAIAALESAIEKGDD